MDEPREFSSETGGSTPLALNQHPGSFDHLHVAIVHNDDTELAQLLREQGACLSDRQDPDLDMVVYDSRHDSGEEADWLDEDLLARVESGRVQLVSRWQLLARFSDHDRMVHSLYTAAMLAEILEVDAGTIRSWQRRGLIQPVSHVSKLPYYDFAEVTAARQLATLVNLGIPLATIKQNLQQLARWLPNVDRPLAQLSMIADGNQILLRQGSGLVEPGGQRRLDFDHAGPDAIGDDENEPAVLPFGPADQPEIPADSWTHPDQYMEMADRLEEVGETHEAIAVYRALHFACGATAKTNLRLGELLYRVGGVAAACERYYAAVELDEALVEARAALGCVLCELGETELAISAFAGALEHHPDYADVHFHLARALESTGQAGQATRHWERFVELTPAGPWLDEARSRLVVLRELGDDEPN
ncbi:MAG: MerR family transcriptional regulator [Pirellulaceae bacterium]